jgi:hypothetical protein
MGGLSALLALLLSPLAMAARGALVIEAGPDAGAPGARERTREALSEAGVSRAGFTTAVDLERSVGLVSIASRAEDDACGGMVPIDQWRRRLAEAETAPLERALSELALLDLDATCLDQVPPRDALERIQLGLVRAHLEMAARPGSEQGFHQDQAREAAATLAGLAPELPAGLDPGTAGFIQQSAPPAEAEAVAEVAGGGPGGRVYVDGLALDGQVVSVSAGPHLIQVVSGGLVTAAARPFLPEGDLVLWAGLLVEGELTGEVEALAAAGAPAPLLQVFERLVGEPIVVAALSPDDVRLYAPDGQRVGRERQGPRTSEDFGVASPEEGGPRRERPLGTWSLMVGAGGVAGMSDFAYGPVDLLGPSGGGAVWARGAISGDWIWSAALHLQARPELLPENYEEDWLWRAHLPIRAGARYGPPREAVSGDVGLELMVVSLGSYDEKPRFRVGPAVAGGGSFPLALDYRARLEGWFGGGPAGWWSGGLTVGLEHSW